MVNLVLDFVACLRAGDLRVSSAEVLDCLKQLRLVDVFAEDEFRTTLRTNFVKSRRDQPRFDRLYGLFFHDLIRPEGDAPEAPLAFLSELKDPQAPNEIQDAILDFLAGNPLEFLELLQRIQNEEAPTGIKFNLGPLASRLEVLVAINNLRDQVLQHTGAQGKERQINSRLERAFRLLMDEPPPENEGLRRLQAHEQHHKALGERSFGSLSAQEVLEMREVISQLVRKLKDIVSRRAVVMDRGELDVKKTLRLAQRYHGVPIEIRYHNRPKRKARIVTLCDVSSSVWSAARFMLNVLYSLQECFAEVRSFIFVAGLAEVTPIFKENEVNQAIDKVLKETDLKYHVPTDYGKTFRQFKNEYLDILDKKTTLIIIGDGRTNYMLPEEGILAEMRERSRRLIWLNPEPLAAWYTGDSELRTYEPYCHELRAARTLNQLMEFVEELVL